MAPRPTRKMVFDLCRKLPGTTEDIKWGDDIVFSVGAKMYVATGTSPKSGISLKTSVPLFEILTEREGIRPAKYLAKHHWITVEDLAAVTKAEMTDLIKTAHRLVLEKLSKKKQRQILSAAT